MERNRSRRRTERHRVGLAVAAAAPPPAARLPATERRAAILQAAARLFARQGFEATTVRQIADEVKILSGSLYHYFETKEEMLHDIIHDPAMAMRRNIVRISRAEVDAEHRLIALISMDLRAVTSNNETYSIIMNERRIFKENKEFSYVIKAKKDGYAAWRKVLEEGREAGLFRRDLDIHLCIVTTMRMLQTAADWWADEDSAVVRSEAKRRTVDGVIDFNLNFALAAVRTASRVGDPIPRAECEALAAFRT